MLALIVLALVWPHRGPPFYTFVDVSCFPYLLRTCVGDLVMHNIFSVRNI